MSGPKSGYVCWFRVRFSECDPLGHVNNAVYLTYLEQAAIDHAAFGGWPESRLRDEIGAVFVARKHEIEYLRPATEGMVLEVRTWPSSMTGARAFRDYEIGANSEPDPARRIDRLIPPADIVPFPRHDLIVRARTEWAFMNVTTGRPVRIPHIVIDDFLIGA
ncbi:MAG TPA: thioesterase family protein [Thermomicrobiales bacterium]|nr:thioesterase family protein [Thermomicrobiales bacterium]